MRDFAELWPERFYNVTNGVTPRRFIALANPELASLITSAVGPGWLTELDRLQELEPLASDAAFVEKFLAIKRRNKQGLSEHAKRVLDKELDLSTMFDVQVKRIHEYKRQVLNLLHVLTLYNRIRRGQPPRIRRTVIFAGKAAPGYAMAKLVIRLVHAVGNLVQRDPEARRWLDVCFIPDFNVKIAERIYPAADLSEQISTAGKEASGTSNMKLAQNGALTIGTLDGANVEMRERVGAENFFLFGLHAHEVQQLKAAGYQPRQVVERDAELRDVLALLSSSELTDGEPQRFAALVHSLLGWDEYCVLADYRAYVDMQERAAQAFATPHEWTRRAILTVARMGYFSSDRSISEYCKTIWHAHPVRVNAPRPAR
jgi:glycogen phosphorylase